MSVSPFPFLLTLTLTLIAVLNPHSHRMERKRARHFCMFPQPSRLRKRKKLVSSTYYETSRILRLPHWLRVSANNLHRFVASNRD